MVANVIDRKILVVDWGALRKSCVYIAKGIAIRSMRTATSLWVAITNTSGSRSHKWRHAGDNGHPILSVIDARLDVMPKCDSVHEKEIKRFRKKTQK